MKFSEAPPAKFDPEVRMRDGNNLMVVFTPFQWMAIERKLGRHVGANEISDLILGCFLGGYKIVKR